MRKNVRKYRSLVGGIVEPISLRNWSGNLIKRDKSFRLLSGLKILGVIDFFPDACDPRTSCQDHSQPLAKLNSTQVIKAIIFLMGSSD